MALRRRPRRVAVVEHERVAVRIGEERHVADAGVERVAPERHAARLELGPRALDVVDVQRDGIVVDMVLGSGL
jgi:hypothetical protein